MSIDKRRSLSFAGTLALLATVAGLVVAIPALFGYNYLLTRNKNVTANMQVFVDEFITRLAELHRSIDQKSLEG